MSTECSIVVEGFTIAEGQSRAAMLEAVNAAREAVGARRHAPQEVIIVTREGQASLRGAIPSDELLRHHVVANDSGYDEMKNSAAEIARGEYVVFLDGDCCPDVPPGEWLGAMLEPLLRSEAVCAAGTTYYAGRSPLSLAFTLVDFGFLADDPDGEVGCYASNNAAFVRDVRLSSPCPATDLRCSCYLHAQMLHRSGYSVRHVSRAAVRHELPPLVRERLRRGADAVIASRLEPASLEAGMFRQGNLSDLARFYVTTIRWDLSRASSVRRMRPAPTMLWWTALVLIPFLRLIDIAGAASEMVKSRDARRTRSRSE